MGNHRILDARKHLIGLIMQIDCIEDSEHAHNLAHAVEVLIQCEHTEIALDSIGKRIQEFPTEIDFD